MKSKFLLTCLALAFGVSVSVQAQKVTIMKDRLLNACYRTALPPTTGGVYINDSDVYTYSGTKGGAPKNTGTAVANNWAYSGKYDVLTRRRYDTATAHPPHFYLRDQTTNHYTGSNNNLDTSTYQTYDTVATVYKNRARTVNIYDGSNNLTFSTIQGWRSDSLTWHDSLDNWYTYSGSTLLTDTFRNLSNINQNRLYLYHYNTGVLDTFTQMNWNSTSSSFALTSMVPRIVYFLNSSLKPDSTVTYAWSTGTMSWNANNRIYYVYSGGKVVIDSTFSLFGPTWYISTNNYTYAGLNITSDTSKANIGSGFASTSLYVMTYDGSGHETSNEKYALVSSVWKDTALVTNTYDPTYGVITQYLTQTRIAGAWAISRSSNGFGGYNYDVMNNYYYGSYDDAVPNTSMNNGSLKLYPVPANGMLNIDLTWDNAQTSVIAIYDMTGRLWMQWGAENTANYKHTVYTSQLPAGNYILKVRGAEGQAAQPFVIAR